MKLISIVVAASIVTSSVAVAPWVKAASTFPSPETSNLLVQRTCAVVNDPDPPLNVRSGPSTNFRILGQLNNGTQVVIVEEQEGWYRVIFNSEGGTGWVAGNRVIVTSCN
ncbi:SH3 domain-containing protein [Baaleninema sp.]|uniref:SH3 domain-containing protein n=1 Tax=Baaleninema sp. TaxID=3101197 RepID=UPI003D0428EA